MSAFSYPHPDQNGVLQETIWYRGERMGQLQLRYLQEDSVQWKVDLLDDRRLNLEEHFKQTVFEDGGWIPYEFKEDAEGECFFEKPEGDPIKGVSAWVSSVREDDVIKEKITYRVGAWSDSEDKCWGAIQFSLVMVYPDTVDAIKKQPRPSLDVHLDGLYVHQYHRSLGVGAGLIALAQDMVVHHTRMARGFMAFQEEKLGRRLDPEIKIATPATSSVRRRVLHTLGEIKMPAGSGFSM